MIHVAGKQLMPVHIRALGLLNWESLLFSKLLRAECIGSQAVVVMVRLVVSLEVLLQKGEAVLIEKPNWVREEVCLAYILFNWNGRVLRGLIVVHV